MIMDWLHNLKMKIGLSGDNGNKPVEEDLPESPDTESEADVSLLDELPGVLDTLNESVQRFNLVAQEQKMVISHHSSSLHQIATTSEEFVATAQSISDNAATVEESALQSLNSCNRGDKSLEVAMEDIKNLAQLVNSQVANSRELEGDNIQISEVADIISEITDQLNLLALNAQIEAVGAGVHGKRFSVVAQEVRRLSENSKQATVRIQKIIKKILEDIDQLAQFAQAGLEAANNSLDRMNRVVANIKNINNEVETTHQLAREIKISTQQQTSAQKQLALAVTDIDALGTQNANAVTEQVTSAITQLSDLAQYLSLILEETVLNKSQDDENTTNEGDPENFTEGKMYA